MAVACNARLDAMRTGLAWTHQLGLFPALDETNDADNDAVGNVLNEAW